jgi:hypothetical protein
MTGDGPVRDDHSSDGTADEAVTCKGDFDESETVADWDRLP